MPEQFDQKTYDELYSARAKYPRKIREEVELLQSRSRQLEANKMTASAMRVKVQILTILRNAQRKFEKTGGVMLGS